MINANILRADIFPPLEGRGVDFGFDQTDGPAIASPLRAAADVERVRVIEAEAATPYLFEAIRRARLALRDRAPLLGFSGAPFTPARYMIEGGHSPNYDNTKAMMKAEPAARNR